MRLKNINPLEKNIDKAVIGLTVLFLLFVAWAYVVRDRFPNADTVDDEVVRIAQRLEDKLDDPAPPILEFQVPEYADQFEAAIAAPLTPASPIADIGPSLLATPVVSGFGLALTGDFDLRDGQPRYRPLEVPAPTQVAARADLVTLDPRQDPAVLAQVGGRPPFDLQTASIAARVDITGITEQLQRRPADLNVNPIPTEWLRETFAIVDLRVERRRQLPDGSWSDPVVIDPMPARASLRDRLDEVTRANAMQYIEAARSQQVALIQPEGYLLKNNVWQPPTLTDPQTDATTDAADAEIDPDHPNYQRIRQLQLRMRQIQNAIRNAERRPPSPAVDAEIERLNGQLDQVRRQLAQLGVGVEADQRTPARDEPWQRPRTRPDRFADRGMDAGGWRELGGEPGDDFRDEFGPDARGARETQARFTGSLLNQESIDVWTQDLTIEPGLTYQYRVRLVATNPLFGRALPESQEELRDQFVLLGEWSDWTEPVQTHQMRYFWVTNASRDVGYATVELWRFHDGIWKKAEMNVFPGDPIGAPSMPWEPLAGDVTMDDQQAPRGSAVQPFSPAQPIDFLTDFLVVDIDFDHRLLRQVGGIGLAQSTTQLIYTERGDQMLTRLLEVDRERIEPMMMELLGEGAFMTEEQRRRMLQEQRAERLRQEREGAGERRPDRGGEGDYGPPEEWREFGPERGPAPRY